MASNTVNVFDFLDSSLDASTSGLCVLFGNERFLKRLALDHLIRNVGGDDEDEFVVSKFESDNAQWVDIHDELSTRSLFGGDGPRIVVVDHADKFVKENRDRLEDWQASKPENGLLVLIVDSWASNTKLYKSVDKTGRQVRCEAPTKSAKSRTPDPAKTSKWLIARAKKEYEFELPSGGAELLMDLTEFDFGRMDQELQKMSLYADEQGKIEQKQIKQIIGGWRSRTMWETIDAAVAGESGKAIHLLDQLLRSGEHPLALFGQMSWSLRRYAKATELVMRQMRTGRKPNLEAAVKQAGFRAWGGELAISQANLKQLGRERAQKMIDWLLEADLQLKRSHSKDGRGRLVLEKLIMRMSRELSPNT